MMMRYLLLIWFALAVQSAVAQGVGKINMYVDPAIEQLIQRHIQFNRQKPVVHGFRIQIIQDSDRDAVRAEKSKLLNEYPQIRVYESYDSPFYKIRVGNYKTRFEAQSDFVNIKKDFRMSFIVPDVIDIAEME